MTDQERVNLKPENYLNPELFATIADSWTLNRTYGEEQYKKGLGIGQQAIAVYINQVGTWGTSNKDHSSTQSYERIGYHACTAQLLRGFIDSGCPIFVCRVRIK